MNVCLLLSLNMTSTFLLQDTKYSHLYKRIVIMYKDYISGKRDLNSSAADETFCFCFLEVNVGIYLGLMRNVFKIQTHLENVDTWLEPSHFPPRSKANTFVLKC